MYSKNDEITILLVDDCDIFRETLCSFLKRKTNFQVVGHAADGSEALTIYDQLTPDVVVMDLNMPVLDGIEATKRLIAAIPLKITVTIFNMSPICFNN